MKLRPYRSPKEVAAGDRAPRKTTHEIELPPRSAYLITGEARSGYEHSIAATADLRYSVTFRTLRERR
jgi:DNA oxidative demethylase